MRNYEAEYYERVNFITRFLAKSGASGIVYGNSGGKDSALVGILCKAACDNTLGLIMPCTSKRNYHEDADDAMTVARQYQIETRTIDLTPVKDAAVHQLSSAAELSSSALSNMAPRLRMMILYAVARIDSQMSLEEKESLATVIIDNRKSIEKLKSELTSLYTSLDKKLHKLENE